MASQNDLTFAPDACEASTKSLKPLKFLSIPGYLKLVSPAELISKLSY
jgi:hypothetical protein